MKFLLIAWIQWPIFLGLENVTMYKFDWLRYDNIIESIQDFNESAGFGCILAHSMGLGKTIQVITFTDIFFRSTKSKKALIICPVNTIQNWFNEFEKWMPK